MNDDTISRRAAIDTVSFECGEWIGLARTINDGLRKLPSAEPQRKKGEWIMVGEADEDGNALYECSCCHKGVVHRPIVKASYCWNCGAKMEGEE